MLRTLKIGLLCVLGVAVAALTGATFLPFVHTKWWFVRLMDFPRVLYMIALVAVGLTLLAFLRRFTWTTLVLLSAVVAALVTNALIMWPYRPSGDTALKNCPAKRTLSVVIANVELGNRESAPLLKAVADQKPDLFLAMEIEDWWDNALQPIAADMPHTVQKLTGSYHGIHFFSRLPLVDPTIHVFANRDTQSVATGVTLHNDETVTFIGMHPKPPIPGQSSLGRDAELYADAQMLQDKAPPAILAGDLNAVPWEQAVERMRRIAGLVDPRRGYGYVAPWNARCWWAKWPLDNIFDRGGFGVLSLELLDAFGSDHYPNIVRLCRETSPPVERPTPWARTIEKPSTRRSRKRGSAMAESDVSATCLDRCGMPRRSPVSQVEKGRGEASEES